MKIVRFVISLVITFLFISVLNNRLVNLPLVKNWVKGSSVESLPALGRFMNPFDGFWQNAEGSTPNLDSYIDHDALSGPVEVVYDNRLVPHIFGENMKDVVFVQAYVTAQQRLWQMEFQTHAAAGRLAEIIGDKALNYDKRQRRKGLAFAAENSLRIVQRDLETKELIAAYTEGVNAYINSLSSRNYPIEYKLLGYEPEAWSMYKTILLLKYMADDLTGNESDIELTNTLKLLGEEDFNLLFPDYPKGQDPVIPADTPLDFEPIRVNKPKSLSDTKQTGDASFIKHDLYPKKSPLLGSNNWAMSGTKTANKKTILCNDPHLRLSLPSLWFEVQLVTPNDNVYGVSLPGAPGVIIGFNKHIAWGVTNAGRDVKDWYTVKFKNTNKNEYWLDNKWEKTTKRVEEIKVRDGISVLDTVV
jgi:penicillin amidase